MNYTCSQEFKAEHGVIPMALSLLVNGGSCVVKFAVSVLHVPVRTVFSYNEWCWCLAYVNCNLTGSRSSLHPFACVFSIILLYIERPCYCCLNCCKMCCCWITAVSHVDRVKFVGGFLSSVYATLLCYPPTATFILNSLNSFAVFVALKTSVEFRFIRLFFFSHHNPTSVLVFCITSYQAFVSLTNWLQFLRFSFFILPII